MKPQFDEFEKTFVFPATEIDHVFVAMKVDPNAANAARPGGPMGGNPVMGMPGGMPGMGGGNRSGIQDGIMILRLKNPHGGKGLDKIQQQFPPKSYKDVGYHVSTVPNGPAFFFGDDRHVLLGEPAQIEKIIDRKDQSENKELLAYFAKEQHFTMTALSNGTGGAANLPPALSQSPQFQNLQKLTQDISKARVDVNMPSGVDLKISLTCKTDAAAQQVLTEANKGLDGLKQQAAILKFAFPDIDSVLNTIKVNQSGTNFEGSLSVSQPQEDGQSTEWSYSGDASFARRGFPRCRSWSIASSTHEFAGRCTSNSGERRDQEAKRTLCWFCSADWKSAVDQRHCQVPQLLQFLFHRK
ncbi:MAG: hypothetical protein FD138_2109 [Planctomycetota bacterium]|nr:MAG: hypothetical protein FD138_2109 [Planctomycetota bacterium]